jgi:hypothetical protein
VQEPTSSWSPGPSHSNGLDLWTWYKGREPTHIWDPSALCPWESYACPMTLGNPLTRSSL